MGCIDGDTMGIVVVGCKVMLLGIGELVGATVGLITTIAVGDSEGLRDAIVGDALEGKVDGRQLEVTTLGT